MIIITKVLVMKMKIRQQDNDNYTMDIIVFHYILQHLSKPLSSPKRLLSKDYDKKNLFHLLFSCCQNLPRQVKVNKVLLDLLIRGCEQRPFIKHISKKREIQRNKKISTTCARRVFCPPPPPPSVASLAMIIASCIKRTEGCTVQAAARVMEALPLQCKLSNH